MSELRIAADTDLYSAAESYPPDDWQSETTSIGSSLYRGFFENDRRYQTLKHGSFVPSDEQQFDAYEAGHVTALLMESHRPNPLFRSPVKDLKHVLDIGTGKGSWAVDVADMFPDAVVRGVDLYPPPITWIPPNCILEVDDILEEWTWQQRFDLVHMRIMDGAFSHKETERLYQHCFNNLRPGGWIEQLELLPEFDSEDNALPLNSPLKQWSSLGIQAAFNSGHPFGLYHRCTDFIRQAGFVDVHEEVRKWPVGAWPRDQQLKEGGSVNLEHWSAGMEGYTMYLFTNFGVPTPWSKEEVQVLLAQARKDLRNPRHHLYHRAKRVWARKPFPDEVVIRSIE